MYLLHIRTKPPKELTTICVSAENLTTVANLLENSKDVINFKVNDGLSQNMFSCGGYSKWVTCNYPENTEK